MYVCNHGYDLLGSIELTCNEEGNWYPTPPICVMARSNGNVF